VARQTGASLRQICSVLQLPRSTYYQPVATDPDQQIRPLIGEIFQANRRCYGYRRIACELARRGVCHGQQKIRRIMRQQGLQALQRKRFTPRTSDGRASNPCANLLFKAAPPTAPNQVWAGDITYIETARGWLYLAVVIDLCSRRIIGWSVAPTMQSSLVIDALGQAVQTRKSTSVTIFHSDRGSQYSSGAFREMIGKAGLQQSMSRLGNPYDNAWTESFMGTLKAEMSREGLFTDLADARIKLFSYIDGFYNQRRLHSSIGYVSPKQFEEKFSETK